MVTESCLMERQMQSNEIKSCGKVAFKPNQVQVKCFFIICSDIKHILLEPIFMIWVEPINQQFYRLFWKTSAFLLRNVACTLAAHGARMLSATNNGRPLAWIGSETRTYISIHNQSSQQSKAQDQANPWLNNVIRAYSFFPVLFLGCRVSVGILRPPARWLPQPWAGHPETTAFRALTDVSFHMQASFFRNKKTWSSRLLARAGMLLSG